MNVWLIGMMGAGKTAAGTRLAELLGFDFVDSDRLIESDSGFSIPDLFEFEGESGFRERESDAIRQLSAQDQTVVATGGGVVLNPENRRLMSGSGVVVWLQAEAATIVERLAADPTVRPLAENREAIERLCAERADLYEEASTLSISTDRLSIEETARGIEALL